MTSVRPRGRQPAETAERTRAAIVAAAMRLFAERGFTAVSLRHIADEAGVTHGLIRHHFGSKAQVWQEVLDRADATYVAAMRPALDRAAAEPDPVAALETIVGALTDTAARHPEITRLLLGESTGGGPRLRQIIERMAPLRAALGPLLRRLQDRGRLTTLDPENLFLIVLLAGAAPFSLTALTREITGREPLTGAYSRRHADRLLDLLTG